MGLKQAVEEVVKMAKNLETFINTPMWKTNEVDDQIDPEEEFLANNIEYDPDDPADLGNRKESIIL